MQMQCIQRDSLVVTASGQLGRVDAISIFYSDNQPPLVGVTVYLLLDGVRDTFLPSDLTLRSNSDNDLLDFNRFTDTEPHGIREINPEEIF
jgi:hypothetical protein